MSTISPPRLSVQREHRTSVREVVGFDLTERQAIKSSNLRGGTADKFAEPVKTVFVAPSELNMVRRIAHTPRSTRTYVHHLAHSGTPSAVAWTSRSSPRLNREPVLRVVSAVQVASAMSRNTRELARRELWCKTLSVHDNHQRSTPENTCVSSRCRRTAAAPLTRHQQR